jgi:DNA-binding LytR/AlgR family response regulator
MDGPRRILIVEDEPLVSMDISQIIEDTIPAVIIIKSSVAETKKVLDQEFDFALLDIDVTNGKTYQVADLLGDKKVPFVFVSGSVKEHLPEHLRHIPFIAKPYKAEQIKHAILTADERPAEDE